VVGVYDHDDDLVSAIVHFLSGALADGGTAVVVATPTHRAALGAALARAGHAVEALTKSGAYVALDADDTLDAFMVDERPDAERFRACVESVLPDPLVHPGPVRLFGEMVALLWERGNLEGAIALESLWNDLAEHHSFALFCAYAMSALETSGNLDAAMRMCDRHSIGAILAISSPSSTGPSAGTKSFHSESRSASPSRGYSCTNLAGSFSMKRQRRSTKTANATS
jgi:hypothetical protein